MGDLWTFRGACSAALDKANGRLKDLETFGTDAAKPSAPATRSKLRDYLRGSKDSQGAKP